MPIYSYRCTNCGNTIDAHQKFSDGPLTVCSKCAQEALVRVYKPVGVIFKGSGFYATDNKTSPLLNGSKSSDSSHADSKNGSSEKTESKQESIGTDFNKSESKKSESVKSETKKSESKSPAAEKSN